MKKSVFVTVLLSGLFLLSCNNRARETAPVEEVDVLMPATTVTANPQPGTNVVSSTVSDNQGNTIHLIFDNERGTGTVHLNNDTIYMIRDTTASGVRMHNNDYEYEEWQGRVVLKRNGTVVFDSKN